MSTRMRRWLTGWRRSAAMLIIAVVVFALMIALAPTSQENPWLALVLFAAVLGVVRMLSQFEKPA